MRYPALLLLTPIFALAACYHSTQMAATWRDPAAPPLHFQHGVAVFVTRDEALRRSVEDKLVARFPNMTPSYRVLATVDSTAARDETAEKLRAAGFDGAIVMRVVDVTNQLAYVPGAYWNDGAYGFHGYWSSAWAAPYDPYYVSADQIVSVETQIYSLTNDKLIFAARSETTNPSSAKQLTDSVIRHIREELRKNGLLAVLWMDDMTSFAH